MTYIKQCALIDAHDEHRWFERRQARPVLDREVGGYRWISDGYDERTCHGKPIEQRTGELAHERKL